MSEKEQKPIAERYLSVMDDMMELKLQAASKQLSDDLDVIIQSKVKEIEKIAQAGIGVKEVTTINKAEIIRTIRKAALENGDSGKRTPAPAGPQSVGPTGTNELTPLEKAVKDFEEGKQ